MKRRRKVRKICVPKRRASIRGPQTISFNAAMPSSIAVRMVVRTAIGGICEKRKTFRFMADFVEMLPLL
jgi:hypothetical protein